MSAAAGPLVNGFGPSPPYSVNEALEYERILKLRDEVFAGSHSRLTVPAQAHKTTAPQVSQPQLNLPPLFSTSTPNQSAFQQNSRETIPSPAPLSNGSHASNAQQTPSSVSEFDPVLLTKSDDLLRAETQLKRQRLEKALRDQFEQKRLEARKRPAPAEAKPDFDISSILARALEVAKPSFKDDASASDSFDENSFYSSKAPDSTPERGAPSPSPSRHQMDVDDFDADAPSGRVQSAVMGPPLHIEPEGDDSPRVLPSTQHRATAVDLTNMDLDDEEEEGEYSPPEAMEQYPTHNDSQALQDSRDPRSRPLRRYSEFDDGGRRPASPSNANMRIVRNHITSPIAPQPSRISPLAVAKDGSLLQNGRMRREQGRHQANSPEPGQHPRKKRKIGPRGPKGRRNGGLSPDAFIKEENVSPPPFHDVQPLGSGRIRPSAADRPIIIDDSPSQYVSGSDRYLDSPMRPPSRQVMPLSEPRVLSRATRRPARDDQDLRRVASMHNLRPEQHREDIDVIYDSPTRAKAPTYRAASPMVIEQRPEEYDRVQDVRIQRTPVPIYREVYDAEPEIRYQPMPPPPVERIIVDQYGRRLREIIQPERTSVAPRAMSVRPSEIEPSQYEPYREIRSGSGFVEPQLERRYEMAPPQTTYRVVETPRASVVSTREQYDIARDQRGASIQVIDRSSRNPTYVDDRSEFKEPMRMTSVRPRYEEAQPREGVLRAPSVREVGREGSVLIDDRGSRRDYLPVEQPRYRVLEPEERFFDAQGREVITIDGTREGRRVVQRY